MDELTSSCHIQSMNMMQCMKLMTKSISDLYPEFIDIPYLVKYDPNIHHGDISYIRIPATYLTDHIFSGIWIKSMAYLNVLHIQSILS